MTKVKTNYFIQSLKSCATCKHRIRSGHFELFCHKDKGPLDYEHLVSERGMCSEYQESIGKVYQREENNAAQ
jgi:hypothetical protein